VVSRNPGMAPGRLLNTVRRSTNHKGRLLHYLPPGES
jgi:hypothetical protein